MESVREKYIPRLFVPLEAEMLLSVQNYYLVDKQIVYFHEELQMYVITVINENEDYDETDYKQLPFEAPYQLIQAKLVFMQSPTNNHQAILMRLSASLFNFVEQYKLGQVRFAPLDVKFDEHNIFQPDLMFISIKRSSIIKKWIFGAPDFIVEILSPSTEKYDREKKMPIYARYEVLEYWLVDVKGEKIEVYHNHRKKMKLVQIAEKTDTIRSVAIEGLELELWKVF